LKVAAANWEVRRLTLEVEFFHHIEEFVDAAVAQGVELLVLPEQIDLEMLSSRPELTGRGQAEWLASFQTDVREEAAHLAAQHDIAIVCGSTFVLEGSTILNRSWMVLPDGSAAAQDKLVMTQFELDDWGVASGEGLVRMPDPRFGISVCYDCEFPAGVLVQAEAGVLALCVPTFTETWHGFHRVRHCCQARAVENQIFVLQASLFGSLGQEPVPEAHGSAAILAPCVAPFPPDGVLDETERDREGLAVADLDFEALLTSRTQGDVRNWDDRHKGHWSYSQI
jgi:predicted amidohydrolase